MRKKLISMLLCATMVATMATGCGDSSGDDSKPSSGANSEGRPGLFTAGSF